MDTSLRAMRANLGLGGVSILAAILLINVATPPRDLLPSPTKAATTAPSLAPPAPWNPGPSPLRWAQV